LLAPLQLPVVEEAHARQRVGCDGGGEVAVGAGLLVHVAAASQVRTVEEQEGGVGVSERSRARA